MATLDAQGIIDPHKVGVIGFSFTDWYVENELVKAPDRFAAATIAEGADNSYSQYLLWGSANPQLRKQMEAINGGQPFGADLIKWVTRAPAFHLDQVKAPIRIEAMTPGSLIGEWECTLRCACNASLWISSTIRTANINSRGRLERLVSAQGNVDWFRFWLQGYENPDPAKFQQYERSKRMRQINRSLTP